ncbi:hypothetical protein SAMN06265171_101935 [Chryseobacterium rhizoplanae]|uniref:Lipoprotein n=1 Tax=Chryseobacterium rhizoplanae TaxID=1609531 RepID=A0A521BEC1_9FLAO|nr:hypothetical protein [Chryseobacterium rhizoplanae]SMO45403.1 hypothetical protein SAMN06265171_101935 [Chryseobacterium rhizoplanae]
MKATALILGVISLFAFTSCRCNIDEDENKKRDQKNNPANAGKTGLPENDTLSIR